MIAQIFTRNFIGRSIDYELKKEDLVGGAEIYIYDLCKILKKEFDAEIEIIQTGNKNITVHWDGIKIKKIFIPSWMQKTDQYFFTSMAFKKHINENALKVYSFPHYAYLGTKDPSIGIFHGVDWDIPSFGFYISSEIKYYERNLVVGLLYGIARYIYIRRFTPFFCKIGIKKLSKTVCVDHEIFKYIKGIRDKTKVIHSYVDFDYFNPHVKCLNKVKDKKIIFFPQNLSVTRGAYLIPEIATELAKKRKDFVFFVAGAGPLKTYLEKRIKTLQIENFVKLLGHKNHFTEMPKLFATSDIIIIPSTYSEGTSLAALEGMATKKPVLMTNVGGLKEIGTEKEKIIIKPEVNDITEKLNLLLDDSLFRKKLGNRAYRYVRKYHGAERWKKQWIEVIKNLLKL